MYQAILPYPQIDPVLVHLGPLAIRWYALAYIAGLTLGWWAIVRALRNPSLWINPPFKGRPPATVEEIDDLVVWATFGVILGGRLGWDLFYGTILCSVSPYADFCRGLPDAFLTDPIKIIAAWEGGMSFHGGALGVVIAVWLFCRRRKLNLFAVADLVAVVAPIGLFFGRIANFINGELWGRVTDVPWAMIFPRAGPLPRHPSQLYEAALEGIVLFALLQIAFRVFRLHERPGLLTALFLAGYGTVRFFVEFYREPDTQFIGWLSMGMALSVAVWIGAAAMLVVALRAPARVMNELGTRIAALIAAQGPLPVAQYMTLALHDPKAGYYATRDPLGRAGDFITAPEISQMFGEALGLWCVQVWRDQDCPKSARLIELGPGRGTLMADALRAARQAAPEFEAGVEILLIETSPVLTEIQKTTLKDHNVRWATHFDEALSDRPLFLIANEFFDALPIHQYVKTARGWCERMVTAKDGVLDFALAPIPTAAIARAADNLLDGAVHEASPASVALAEEIAATIARRGGAALIIDYGYDEQGGGGETLQAVRRHRFADVLADPGENDLTAHVDFGALAAAARVARAVTFGLVPQGEFLTRLGLAERAERLTRANPGEADAIAVATKRLTGAAEMGDLFKALAILPAGAPPPPGFPC